jgi:hypothetical protein
MQILLPRIHGVRRPASIPVFEPVSGSVPMFIALDRTSAVSNQRTSSIVRFSGDSWQTNLFGDNETRTDCHSRYNG